MSELRAIGVVRRHLRRTRRRLDRLSAHPMSETAMVLRAQVEVLEAVLRELTQGPPGAADRRRAARAIIHARAPRDGAFPSTEHGG